MPTLKSKQSDYSFLHREQTTLRADSYQQLRDSIILSDGNPSNVRVRTILPATFTGGPRYMFERQQDAITYVREYGRPDLFITVFIIQIGMISKIHFMKVSILMIVQILS